MELLVFSDSHGHVQPMLDITADEKPDAVIHLGDCVSDAKELAQVFPYITVYSISGNNDFDFNAVREKEFVIGGKKIFITHGHHFNVKNRIDLLKSAASARGADIVMFGHTHVPLHDFDGKLHILNPGALYRPVKGIKTYAKLTIDDGINIEMKVCR